MGKTIKSGAREVTYHDFKQCFTEYHARKVLTDLDELYKRWSIMTGKSESTVRRIVKEGESGDMKFSTPGKHKTGPPILDVEDFTLCAIRKKVQFFYTARKKAPTLRWLLAVVREDHLQSNK